MKLLTQQKYLQRQHEQILDKQKLCHQITQNMLIKDQPTTNISTRTTGIQYNSAILAIALTKCDLIQIFKFKNNVYLAGILFYINKCNSQKLCYYMNVFVLNELLQNYHEILITGINVIRFEKQFYKKQAMLSLMLRNILHLWPLTLEDL